MTEAEGKDDVDMSGDMIGSKEDQHEDAQALLDLLTLYTTPVLFKMNRHISAKRYPTITDPVQEAFLAMSLRLQDLDDSLVRNNHVVVTHQLMSMLKDCLGNHRWNEVLEIVRVLSLEFFNTSVSLWKVGYELMMSDVAGCSGLMLQLFNQLKRLCDIDSKEVSMDYIKFLLCDGKLDETTQVFQSAKHKQAPGRVPTVRTKEAEIQLRGYQGMCSYVEWFHSKRRLEEIEEVDEDDYFMVQSAARSKQTEENLMQGHMDRALSAFRCIEEAPVTVDLFVTKYVELLEYAGKIEEAESVLRKYAEKNSTNPNTQRYLYWFYKRHDPGSSEMMSALKSYIQLVPSDGLALELCRQEQSRGGQAGVILPVLFNLLDYPVWKDDLHPWETLLSFVTQIYNSNDIDGQAALQRCWEIRSSWWPQYHFCRDSIPEQITDEDTRRLLACKAALSAYLFRGDNIFAKKITEVLEEAIIAVKEAITVMSSKDNT